MAGSEVGFVVDDEYKVWIENIKDRIKHSQIKASVKVNYELLDLYWDIGRDIVVKQKNAKWGESFLATMSKDLRKTFPNMSGFSYLGRQVHLHVGESDFYMDLLFHHVCLHCYVVVELKTEKFKPEFAGKLNFYVTAVNKQMKTEQDNPTIGILICKDKDDVVAEYALDDISQPIGIAEYKLTKVLREEFKSSLPTVEEIESELSNRCR